MNRRQRAIALGRRPKYRQPVKHSSAVWGISPLQACYKDFLFLKEVERLHGQIFVAIVSMRVPAEVLRG